MAKRHLLKFQIRLISDLVFWEIVKNAALKCTFWWWVLWISASSSCGIWMYSPPAWKHKKGFLAETENLGTDHRVLHIIFLRIKMTYHSPSSWDSKIPLGEMDSLPIVCGLLDIIITNRHPRSFENDLFSTLNRVHWLGTNGRFSLSQ